MVDLLARWLNLNADCSTDEGEKKTEDPLREHDSLLQSQIRWRVVWLYIYVASGDQHSDL